MRTLRFIHPCLFPSQRGSPPLFIWFICTFVCLPTYSAREDFCLFCSLCNVQGLKVCVACHSFSIGCIFRHVWDLILPYLQAHNLACYCFVGAGRKHKTPGSETTNCMTHSTASSMNINMFASVPHIPKSHRATQREADACFIHTGFTSRLRDTELGEPSIL